jgi:hypothetical protein
MRCKGQQLVAFIVMLQVDTENVVVVGAMWTCALIDHISFANGIVKKDSDGLLKRGRVRRSHLTDLFGYDFQRFADAFFTLIGRNVPT